MGECSVRLPPLAAGELEAELVRRAPVPASRQRSVEALLDSVEEAARSDEPVVVLIVGEWGEGKTAAWYAYVKPALVERGLRVVEVRAASLADAMRRASWIPSPAWRLAAAIAALVEGGVPGDYRAAVARLAGEKPLTVFIDEVEDLVYRGDALRELLDALHGVVDGELDGIRIHFYLSVSPAAYARITGWLSWRRFRRRVRVVELEPLSRLEAIEALRAMLDYACAGCMPVRDPRLLNALLAASKGNLGALAAYTRRLLAAWARRGCEPLGDRDVARILAEPLVAGLEQAGLDEGAVEELVEKHGEALLSVVLSVVAEREVPGVTVEAEACGRGGGDEAWLDARGDVVFLGGVWAREAGELGWRVSPGECSGARVYALKPRLLAKLYGGPSSLAAFIREEGARREALRAAYRDSRLVANGIALLLCESLGCDECWAERGVAGVALRVRGLRVRIGVVAPGVEPHEASRLLAAWKPHAILAPRGVDVRVGVAKLLGYELEPGLQLSVAAAGWVAGRECRPRVPVDRERIGALAARLLPRIGVPDALLEALEAKPSLIIPPLRPEPLSTEKMLCLMRVALASPGSTIRDVVERAAELCNAGIHALEAGLRRLTSARVLAEREGRVYPALSPTEESILDVLGRLGGTARLSELEELFIPQSGVWDRYTLAWIHVLAAKGWLQAPKRLTGRSRLRVMTLDELRREANAVIDSVPGWAREAGEACRGDEVCERAWLASILWLSSIEAKRRIRAVRVEARESRVQSQLVAAASPAAESTSTETAIPGGERRVDDRLLGTLQSRLVEALRAAPIALQTGAVEELADAIARAKMLARSGRLEDAVSELSIALAAIARGPDTLLLETARRLGDGVSDVIELIEDGFARRRVLERLIARRAAGLVERTLLLLQAEAIADTRLPEPLQPLGGRGRLYRQPP